MKIGIIKEYKSPPDKRVVFSPEKCIETIKKFPEIEFFVEKSEIRCFSDSEYELLNIQTVSDLSHCDVLIGVKEVPVCLLYTSPSPRDVEESRMPSSA